MIYLISNNTFGKNVRRLREKREMSQEELALLLDTTPEIVEEIEVGNQRDIEHEMMEVLEGVFQTDVGTLLSENGL